MHQSQSSPFPVGSTHALGFEGLDTRSVAIIQEWKALRALLADTTQQYLVACTNLGALWTQPQGLLSDRLAIESALTYVDLELSQMISEEEQLRTARIGLTEARNRSFALAPINKLPPEILSHIFITSKNYCLDDIKKHEKSIELLPDVFSGVCTYWRRVALDTPSLWTHIDISPHADTKQHTLSAEMLLQRSQKLPIDLHIIESERLCPSPNNAATLKLARFLTPHMTRVHSLHLDTDSYSRKLIRRMLTSWVANISPDSAYALSIRRPKASVLFYINEEMKTSTRLGSEDHVEEVLSSLRVLHLHNACFNWNCAAYSGLVDLQIHSSTANLEISTLEVVSVLSSSPGLITLKLGNVCLHHAKGSERPSSVSLNRLEVLGLVYMHFDSLRLLIPLIYPPIGARNLSLGITVDEDFVLTPELESFFKRAHITTLYIWGGLNHPNIKHALPLLALLPSLENLGVSGYDLKELSLSTSTVVDKSGTPASLSLPSHFHAPKLCLVDCSVDLDSLSYLVSTFRTRHLQLQACQASKRPKSDLDLNSDSPKATVNSYRGSLCQMFPELECSISKVDSIQHWPCRTTLPCDFPEC